MSIPGLMVERDRYDKIKVRLTVGRKTKRTDTYGEVKWDVVIFNQNDEQVAEYGLLTMVKYEH